MEEISHGAAGLGDHGIGVAARRVGTGGVGVVLSEVAGDGVNHALWDLRAARAIEKRRWMTVDGLGQRRKLRTDPG